MDKNKLVGEMTVSELLDAIRPLLLNDDKRSEVSGTLIPRKDAARLLNVTPTTVDRWSKDGQLPAKIKVGGRSYFPSTVIHDLLKKLG